MMKHNPKKQITLYYMYITLIGTWFTSGVTLFFNRNFLTDTHIGWMEAIAFGVGLLAEIPSGTIADKLGRRKTVLVGTLVSGIGFVCWGVAVAGWMVVVGVLLFALGTSLQSGADEAMMYDYLKAHGQEDQWPRINANGGILARLAYIFSIFLGGIAYVYYEPLPFLLRALTFFVMIIPLVKLAVIDPFQAIDRAENQLDQYWAGFSNGIKELFYPSVRWLVPLFLLVQGVAYTVFTAGILRSLLYEKSGLPVVYHSFAIAIALMLTVLSMFMLRRYPAQIGKKPVIYGLATLCALGFAVNIGRFPMLLSLVGLTLVQVAAYSQMTVLSTALNRAISSRYRATTLSTASFMQSIGYVAAAPAIGFLSDQGLINEVAIGVTLIVVVGILWSLLLLAQSKKMSTT
jgi:MFS family permease